MALAKFKTRLEASSYHAPGGGAVYEPLRQKLVKQAVEQGYDENTMLEHGVAWADDQDPFGHLMNAIFPHYVTACNYRHIEGFEKQLGVQIEDFLKNRGISVIAKRFVMDIKRPVSYPDSLLVGVRLGEVKLDRFHITTTIWSLAQQAVVAESNGWVVFFDYGKGKIANLVETGGVYKDLHDALTEKCTKAKAAAAAWAKNNPPPKRMHKL